ncbi:hypothetical protein FACS189492_2000 [Clostridia bacterium]|nr:hypothetical protein FACS189492_2000 [Clostridia bacterium]
MGQRRCANLDDDFLDVVQQYQSFKYNNFATMSPASKRSESGGFLFPHKRRAIPRFVETDSGKKKISTNEIFSTVSL